MADNTTPRPGIRLFLSYGRRDAADLANRLRADLERLGYEVWQDTRQIRAGKEWEDQIADGLRSTQVVIALLSPHAVRRATDPGSPDYVDSVCLDELTFARFAAPPTPIVPVMAIPCEPPFQVFRLDYVSMTRWMQSEDEYRVGFQRLVEGIEAAASGKPLPFRRWHHCLPVLDFAAQLHEKRQDFVGRQWLFDEIDAWRAGSTRERALLIVADPGIGKSAFVAEMIHRNPRGQVLAYHICRADDPETLRPSTFVMSLAGMIAGRLRTFADLLESPQFQELFDPRTVSSRPAHVFDQGLIAGLQQLHAPTDGIRYLLIDALDEALTLGEGQLNIVTLLSTRLERFPSWLRVVATTRREPDVLNRLSGLRAASIDAHRQDNLDDIDKFIAARLQTPNLAERLAASRVPLATAQQKLRAKADGNFLYVSQALQDIERDNYVFSCLDELPQGLNQWYEAWFARKFPNPKEDFVDARKVLEVILAAREPLTIRLLQETTGLNPHYGLPDATAALSPLIVEASGRYSLFHKSLADWLATCSRFRVSVAAGHERLIHYCKAELERLRGLGDILTHDRTGEAGGAPTGHGQLTYAFHFDFHLSATENWDDYERILDDEWYFQRRFPLAYNLFPHNYVPDDWEVELPELAYQRPSLLQFDMCVSMARRFERLALNITRNCRFELFPDGGTYCESLRDSDSDGFVRFRDGCYTFIFYCFQLIAHLELGHRLGGVATRTKLAKALHLFQDLRSYLRALAMPHSTGLSGRLEDQADSMLDRWDSFAKSIAGGNEESSGNEAEESL